MSTTVAPARRPWLFSPAVDLGVFLGSALISLALLVLGARLGILYDDSPEWTWVSAVLLVDVAHVYATGFRVYFDRDELRRRPVLYWGTPVLCFVAGWGLYAVGGNLLFWRILAYVAVFHFVRQQYGWVALYRSRCGENDALGRWIDTATIYLATLYPLVHWHAHLPRSFHWFVSTDFVAIPVLVERLLQPVYWGMLAIYAVRSIGQWSTGNGNPGRDVVVATTAVCWYVGIITFNSDYAFTVTNVIIHGVPYIALVYWYAARKRDPVADTESRSSGWRLLVMILATIWFLAYVEELVWDRTLWHERSWLFGDAVDARAWAGVLVPLLAVPQLTHYVLDGFIWRRRTNPGFRETVESTP